LDSGSSNRNTDGLAHDGAAHGDALALAARQLRGAAVEIGEEVEDAGRLLDLRGRLASRASPRVFGPKPILSCLQVRKQRIGLEHHGNVALLRRQALARTADQQVAGC
jgi:hypothetical protein